MKRANPLPWAIVVALIFGLLFSSVSLIRHWNYFSQGTDLGIFDQSVWLYSRFLPPFNTITGKFDYQDRYRPVMILLGLFYKILPRVEVLLVIQGFALVLSGLFIYLIAKKLGLGEGLAIFLMLHYFLFPGITSFIIDDFHEVSLFPFFFLGSIYFFLIGKQKALYLFLLISLLIRDYLIFFSFVFWFSLAVIARNNLVLPKHGSLKKLLSFQILMLGLMFIIIKLTGGINYTSFIAEGDTLWQALAKLVSNPLFSLYSLLNPAIKLQTLLISLGYFLFLPLTNIWLVAPIFFQFGGRYLDLTHPYRWTMLYHFSGEITAALSFGTIITLVRMGKKTKLLVAGAMTIVSLLIIYYYHTPLLLLTKRDFWQRKEWMKNNDRALSLIPKEASVASQNNLLPHLSNRREIYLLPEINNAEFVLIDIHRGQDQFNFYSLNYQQMKDLQLSLSRSYDLLIVKGDAYLYKRK